LACRASSDIIETMQASKPGRLIVVEGIDGAGKSTQVARLAQALRERGETVTTSREPTDGLWGRKIRASAVSGRMTLAEELAAFLEDRKEHVATVIRPALERGETVLLDRYYYSTIAYQGARGGDTGAIREANEAIAPKPDLVLLIDFDPEAGLRRIRESRGGVPDEFEKLDELAAIRHLFLIEAGNDPERFRVIDGGRMPDEVFADLLAAVPRTFRNV
jgi:dTMP kinase